ncbi:MAG: molybdopterin molybdenumtransferase MoeA [Methylophaga sp.]|nr:molybdopterin molybdenumtransferase MoeA [Methylophaga sp.]
MTEFSPQPSCQDPVEAIKLDVQSARAQIMAVITPINSWRSCALKEALGEVLHETIYSPVQVPPHHNSAMDGYAIHSRDWLAGIHSFQLAGHAYAGQPFSGSLTAGQCVRIMTGAVVPVACDTVVMQERCEVNGLSVKMHEGVRAGQNVRYAGEDLQIGDVVVEQGRRLTPADLGLIASLGMAELRVRRRPRIAFFSTGDELKSLGQPLAPGQIYDSNRYTLFGMLQRFGADIRDMGVVADDKDALRAALLQASTEADVIITSGGVSVGDADYVKEILTELGQVNFWKIAMKPGRPLTFGHVGDAVFFGLPGNPVSVMVTFYQFVLPALQQLAGEPIQEPLLIKAIAVNDIRKRPGRFEFQRGVMRTGAAGSIEVSHSGDQGSGILRSMNTANCFILLDDYCDGIAAGSEVLIQPFTGLI